MRSILLTGMAVCASLQLASADSPDSAQLYDERYAAGNYSEAAESAKLLVRDAIARDGSYIEHANALEKLANAQLMLGELSAAIDNYQSAIQLIEAGEDMLTSRLVTPLIGLAGSQEKAYAFDDAVAAYERAAHITRVNDGLSNLPQAEILSALIDIYVSHKRFSDARDVQEFQLNVYRRSLSESDPKVIGAWRRSGELLSSGGQHRQAQELYTFATDVIRVADGDNSLAQIGLLNDLSDSYLKHAVADQFTRIELARAQLERVVAITEANAEASVLQRTDAYLRLGDFMQRFGDWNSAVNSYRAAWEQIAADEFLRQETFGTPVLLSPAPSIPETEDVDSQESVASVVTVSFDVDQRGHVSAVRADDNPSNDASTKKAKAATRKLIFRPRLEQGNPVSTPGMVRDVPVVINK